MENQKTFVILSNQFFKVPTYTNKHFVALELSKRGHQVLFVNPPTRFKGIKRLMRGDKRIERVGDILVYTPINLLNFAPFSYINNYIHHLILRRHIQQDPVLWVYHFDFPRIFSFKKLIDPKVFIYDCVDSYADFPEYSQLDTTNKGIVAMIQRVDQFLRKHLDQGGRDGREWVEHIEGELTNRVDMVFTSHPLLYERFKQNKPATYFLPNASNYEEFSVRPESNHDLLENIPEPRVLYSGAIDSYKFDVESFIYLATQTPDIHYALVGPVKLSDSDDSVDRLGELANVHLVGSIPKADIYAHFFDAYIIPYVLNEYTYRGCMPIKFLNVASTGTPTVATELPCYYGLEGHISENYRDIVYQAKYPKLKLDITDEDRQSMREDLVSQVRQAVLDKDENKRTQRQAVASQNTWKNKVDKQLELIGEVCF